jgi:hypothetical protein
MARSDGIDELDPRFPIGFTLPPAIFDQLLRNPPEGVPAPGRLVGFVIEATQRAFAQDMALASARTFRVAEETAPMPVIRVEAPRVYPELEPETLAHEFTGPLWDATLTEEVMP